MNKKDVITIVMVFVGMAMMFIGLGLSVSELKESTINHEEECAREYEEAGYLFATSDAIETTIMMCSKHGKESLQCKGATEVVNRLNRELIDFQKDDE